MLNDKFTDRQWCWQCLCQWLNSPISWHQKNPTPTNKQKQEEWGAGASKNAARRKKHKINQKKMINYQNMYRAVYLIDGTKCKSNSRNTSEGFRSSCLEHEVLRRRDLECWDQVDRPRTEKHSLADSAAPRRKTFALPAHPRRQTDVSGTRWGRQGRIRLLWQTSKRLSSRWARKQKLTHKLLWPPILFMIFYLYLQALAGLHLSALYPAFEESYFITCFPRASIQRFQHTDT